MKRRHALLLAALITGLVASNLYLLNLQQREQNNIHITIARVIDGDTFETTEGEKIRLANINTPEKNTLGADQATHFLKQFENQTLLMEDLGADKYQRTLARIYTPEGTYLNREIIKQGLAVKFLVEESETKLFAETETQAIQNQRGIWTHSEKFNCIHTDIDARAETVLLTNLCPPLNLENWFLKDESRKTYTFQNITIINKITLHSTQGTNDNENIYWNLNTNVWNNDRDTLYLFDDQARIVTTESYGY